MLGYLTGFDDVFDQFERIQRQMDGLANGWPTRSGIRSTPTGTFPAINVGASPERVEVYVFAAGVDPKSLNVELQQNLLSVSGERKVEAPEGAEGYRDERFTGAFRRVVTLPEDVDPDKVNAAYRDGVLRITIERQEAVKPRRIEVH